MGLVAMFTPWDLRPTVEITTFTLTAISTLIVAVRFYCRVWVVGKLKSYDYIMFGALACTWGLCVIDHYQLKYGTGEHVGPPKDPPPDPDAVQRRILGGAKSWYAYQIMYLANLALIKFSILAFYLSIATSRTFRILVHLTIVAVAVFSVVMILVNALQCPKKPSVALSPAIFHDRGKGHCFDLVALYYSQAAFNMVSDLVILVLPMPLLMELRMTIKRVGLLAIFSVGLLVPIASGIRLWSLLLWASSGPLARYYGGYVIFWSQVEINTAIITSSLPSLQPLFKRLAHGLTWFQRFRSAYYYYGDATNTMPQATVGQTRINVSPVRNAISSLESPPLTYQPRKRSIENGEKDDCVYVQEVDKEEEIRNRVRAFSSYGSSHRSSTYSHQPKSPAHPTDIFSFG